MENELYHYGIHGMRWGIRRYQNKDGTLTAAGQKRYRKELARLKNEEIVLKNRKKAAAKFEKLNSKRKELDDMRDELSGKRSKKFENIDKPKELSDQELAQKVARLRMEKDRLDLERQISELTPKKISVGKQMIEKFGPTIVRTLWNDVGKPNINNFINKQLGLKDENSIEKLEKEVKKMRLDKEKAQIEDFFSARESKKEKEVDSIRDKKHGKVKNKEKEPENSRTEQTSNYYRRAKKAKKFVMKNKNKSYQSTASNINTGQQYVTKLLETPKIAGFLPPPKGDD